MPRLSSTIAVAVIALAAIGTVDGLSPRTSNDRIYSRHFARHHPAPRTNKHDVAVSGLETAGNAAVAGLELQGSSSSEPQRRSYEVNEIRTTVSVSPELHEGVVITPPDKSDMALRQRSLAKAAKLIHHADKAVEGATVVGTVTEGVEGNKEGRSLRKSRSIDNHESVSLSRRRKPKKKKKAPSAQPQHEEPKHEEVKPAEPKEEPKPKEEPNEDSKPPSSGTNKHDVAVAGFQAAGQAATALAGMQGSGTSAPETPAPPE